MTQQSIPGTERENDPELVAILEQLRVAEAKCREANTARDKLRDRAKTMLMGFDPDRSSTWERAIAVGDAVYHYTDEKGEEVEAVAKLELKVNVRKTGAAETPIGEGVDAGDDDQDDDRPKVRKRGAGGVHPGLMAAAESAGDSLVEVDEEGEVVVPDKAAKKTKAKKPARRKK